MRSSARGRPMALSARHLLARSFSPGIRWLAAGLLLLSLSTAVASSSSDAVYEGDWFQLDNIGCKDDTTEVITRLFWRYECQWECGKRSECMAYTYNKETKRCFLKETPCEDREPESSDLSGIKAPPFSSAEVTSVLWNFRKSLACFDDDCDIAEWNLLSDSCDWRGVDCQGSQANTIRRLDLSNCGLRGQLPSDFAKLKTLEEIDLSANYLYGKLQADWDLPELTSLDLSGNQLSGYLPWRWSSNIPGIIQLKLNSNRLQGPLPASWWKLKSLHTLDVSDNLLTGKLPKLWSAIGAKQLYLNDNELSGPLPPEWTDIQCLTELNVCNNQLDTTAPLEWISWVTTAEINFCVLIQRSGPRAVPPPVVTADVCGEVQPPPAVYSGWVGETFLSGSPILPFEFECADDFEGEQCREACAEACRNNEDCNAFLLEFLTCVLYRDVFYVDQEGCDDCNIYVCVENCPAGTPPYHYTNTPFVCVEEPDLRIPMTCSNPGSSCGYLLQCYLACKDNDEWCNRFYISKDSSDDSLRVCDLYSSCDTSDYDYDGEDSGWFRLTDAEEEAYLAGLGSG